MATVGMISLGCAKNQVNAEQMMYLLQQAGYKLEEIVEISYRNGNMKSRSLDTMKSRIFLAKQQMRKLITPDGEKR